MMVVNKMNSAAQFISLRDSFLSPDTLIIDPKTSLWSDAGNFNWASDYFDQIALNNHAAALRVVDDAGTDQTLSFSSLSSRSAQVAYLLRSCGVMAGDRVLIMLGNTAPLWETMLAVIKLGAVIIPTSTLLLKPDLEDRIQRGAVKAIVTDAVYAERFAGISGAPIRLAVGADCPSGWTRYADSETAPLDAVNLPTRADALMLLYFTSGTTARPKLVAHSQSSYPVGHLSTMAWIGLRPGDVHLNLSSPGWAKHAWSCFFAPWNAQATVLAYHYERFNARQLLDQLVRCAVTTFCAPPTVWRLLIQEPLREWPVTLRELTSAGEPLNAEVIEQVRRAWGLNIRDGFGQTETTAQVGNLPGRRLKPGSMGKPLPGCHIALLDADGVEADLGEICVALQPKPVGLMTSYLDDPAKNAEVMRDGYYHTGDIAMRDDEGYLTYVGRTDDVFKSSDYRISPFELESVLIEHPAVAEAAVVPSPDSRRLNVPKGFVTLVGGAMPSAELAQSIMNHVRNRVAPFKRIRRLEFADLPKTISGKIRRVELRVAEAQRHASATRQPLEFWEEDFLAG
jgi:acetyl-CoA synthetase